MNYIIILELKSAFNCCHGDEYKEGNPENFTLIITNSFLLLIELPKPHSSNTYLSILNKQTFYLFTSLFFGNILLIIIL